jgi:sugar phosphate isomerase/epimerase
MKLGVAGLFPSDWRNIDAVRAAHIRNSGFLGASLFISRPLEADSGEILKVRTAFKQAGLEIAQANGWYEALVDTDENRRKDGVRGLCALVRIGSMLQAPTTYVRPGGLSPTGHWYPHPENHAPETFDRLVDSLRQVSAFAEGEGMVLAVEGHVLSVLDTPQRVRDLLDAVSSPALKFNIDPVNFIGSVRDVHDTSRILNELFDLLGSDTVAGHAKDLAIRDALVLHIDEVVIGTGVLNYELFLGRFEASCPNGYILIEHLPDERVPIARQALIQKALAARIPLLD